MLAIGSDHGGYNLKENVKEFLEKNDIKYKDFGTFSQESMNYPDIAEKVALAVQSKVCDLGILICRSGIGMAIVANKFKGIRSTPCYNEKTAEFSKLHNDTNVLTIGADYTTPDETNKIIYKWLNTQFEGGRHLTRVQLIEKIEDKNMK